MKVLVTGATGLLGSHIVYELVRRNYRIRALVRPESDLRAIEKFPVELIKGYITRKENVVKAVEGCEYVIHSAALAVHKPTRLEAFREVNIDSTRYVISACMKII